MALDLELLKTIGEKASEKQGGAVGTAIGIGQTISGLIKKKKAEAMTPPMVDPEQRAVQQLARKQFRAFQTGTAMASEQKTLQAREKQAVREAFRFGGIRGLNRIRSQFDESFGALAQQRQQGMQTYFDAYQKATDLIAQRKLELGLAKQAKKEEEAAQNLKSGYANIGAGLGKLLNVKGGNIFNIGGLNSEDTKKDTQKETQQQEQ